jgi:benzoyl-CoA reductase subunit C
MCTQPQGERRMTTTTLEDYKDKPLGDVLAMCRDLYEDPDFPTVARWRKAGGKVLGHFQVYFPEEIAHAAGLLPVKMRGATVEPTLADARFGSYLCSILKTSLEVVLSGQLELDMFVSHPICDAARNLAAIFERNTNYPSQILYLPQNANSKHTITYLRGEYQRVLEEIERVAGKSVSDDDLRKSIGVFNENRSLLRRLYALKRSAPWRIAAEDAYALMSVGGMIPREEHNELLRTLLPMLEAVDTKQQDRIRVVFEGGFCEQLPLDLIRLIGRTCYVVDDDLLIGLRWLLNDVPDEGDPLHNLAHAYIEDSSYSPVQHDLRKPKEHMLMKRVRAAKADAVILAAAKMCEPGLEEQVAYSHHLDGAEVPYFVTEFEENMTSFTTLELQLETFTENLLFA